MIALAATCITGLNVNYTRFIYIYFARLYAKYGIMCVLVLYVSRFFS